MTAFTIGKTYTRKEVAAVIGMAPDRAEGGDWSTGYSRWEDEFFVFCNVNVSGRTGHNYPNRWEGSKLIWYGKGSTTLAQPQVQALLSGDFPVHVFWRGAERAAFTYAGVAFAEQASGEKPVEVVWIFGQTAKAALAAVGNTKTLWRRGPPPQSGAFSFAKVDDATCVYLFKLAGPISATFPQLVPGHSVCKIGMSNDPVRRLVELNGGFPPGCTLAWEQVATIQFPTGAEAFDAEGALLEKAREAGAWIGGEFVAVPDAAVASYLTT